MVTTTALAQGMPPLPNAPQAALVGSPDSRSSDGPVPRSSPTPYYDADSALTLKDILMHVYNTEGPKATDDQKFRLFNTSRKLLLQDEIHPYVIY